MNNKQHKDYIKDIKDYSLELLSSETKTKAFFISAGIHTQTGRLTKVYYSNEQTTKIGFKLKSNNKD